MSSPSVSRGPAGFPKAWSLLVTHRRVLQKRLLAWFRENARDLPWRHRRTPYRVWVSELMLQQTQVATVIPYYLRWMERFPEVATLARAPLATVLKQWEGLGYYRRARFLHEGAIKIVEELGGRFPTTHESLLELPGVGPYTAGAIASLAFGLPTPLVDGNVERVFLRLVGDLRDPASRIVRKGLWELAQALLPPEEPGTFNEGLMELGATVCTPANPTCEACPLWAVCRALKTGKVDRIPKPAPRTAGTKVNRIAVILDYRGGILVQKRERRGRLGDLWQFPEREWPGGKSSDAALAALMKGLGFTHWAQGKSMQIKHSIMNERVHTKFHFVTPKKGRVGRIPANTWHSREALQALAMPVAHRKAADTLL